MQKSTGASPQDSVSSALCEMISKLSSTMDTITSRLQHLESTVQHIQTPRASSPALQVEALPKKHPVNTSFTEKTSVQHTKVQAAFMTPSTAPKRIHQGAHRESLELNSKLTSGNHLKVDFKVPKFPGDAQWHQWKATLLAYFKVVGWLETAEHPVGPGTIDAPTQNFNSAINASIYLTLLTACAGTGAYSILQRPEVPEHSGWHALKALYARYNCFTTLERKALEKAVNELRYVKGTNMAHHVDEFELILTNLGYCEKTLDEDEKNDLFLQTVTDSQYDVQRQRCQDLNMTNELTFGYLSNLYIHRCYELHPQFFTAKFRKKFRQNSTNITTNTGARDPDAKNTRRPSKPNDRRRGSSSKHPHSKKKDQNSKSKKKENTKSDLTCSYCNKKGHEARDCYQRKAHEKKLVSSETGKTAGQNTQHLLTGGQPISFGQFMTSLDTKKPLYSQIVMSKTDGEDEPNPSPLKRTSRRSKATSTGGPIGNSTVEDQPPMPANDNNSREVSKFDHPDGQPGDDPKLPVFDLEEQFTTPIRDKPEITWKDSRLRRFPSKITNEASFAYTGTGEYLVSFPKKPRHGWSDITSTAFELLKEAGCTLEQIDFSEAYIHAPIAQGSTKRTKSKRRSSFVPSETILVPGTPDNPSNTHESDYRAAKRKARDPSLTLQAENGRLQDYKRQLHQTCWATHHTDGVILGPKNHIKSYENHNSYDNLAGLEDTYTVADCTGEQANSGTTLQQFVTNVSMETIKEETYENPDLKIDRKRQIEVIYDTGAAMTQLPLEYEGSWTDLRPCMHRVSGCYDATPTGGLQIGTFHAKIKLDNAEEAHIIFPEALAMPASVSTTYLISDTQFLLAEHEYVSHLMYPKLVFKDGGEKTLSVEHAHKKLLIQPIIASDPPELRRIQMHPDVPYDPPSFPRIETNNSTRLRPDPRTPTALVWRLRLGRPSPSVLKRTHQNVDGMTIQRDSWKDVEKNHPCNFSLAGKFQKRHRTGHVYHSDMSNLAVSTTPHKQNHATRPNQLVSTDWGIVGTPDRCGNTVFALYVDTSIGVVYEKLKPDRSDAVDTLQGYCQMWGQPETVIHDNAREYLKGDFAKFCREKGIKQKASPPYSPNFNPVEKYMDIIVSRARTLLAISGLDVEQFWGDAVAQSVQIQLITALPGRATPWELATGRRPNVAHLRIFGCEALTYVEHDQRKKFNPKTQKCIYLGVSPLHSRDTFKLYNLSTKRAIFRRNVTFNEKLFPARHSATPIIGGAYDNDPSEPATQEDPAQDLEGTSFEDEGETFTIIAVGTKEPRLVGYVSATGEEFSSTLPEVLEWVEATRAKENSVSNNMQTAAYSPSSLAMESFYRLAPEDRANKPTSYKKAGNVKPPQWYRAEDKERGNVLCFNTWDRIPQKGITKEMVKKALRAHHLYDVKRNGDAKNRLVVNGSRQHSSTYTDTTSPVASQLLVRLTMATIALRGYVAIQLDFTNAYLHAGIQDVVLIIIPEGYPGAGEVAILRKALYGTKQGSRRYYDHADKVFKHLGFVRCQTEPCLYRFQDESGHCFLICYVDDSILFGTSETVENVKRKLGEHFKCKWSELKDFTGHDLDVQEGKTSISMEAFTEKLKKSLPVDDEPKQIVTPGRTDIKIIRGQSPEPNGKYRQHVGGLNWLCMGLRYDLVYTTKELSRVLNEPTKDANTILRRALLYVTRSGHAKITYERESMAGYVPPPTRRKPGDDTGNIYQLVERYNLPDAMQHCDDKKVTQDFLYEGPSMFLTCETDIDLGGQVESRQPTSGYVMRLNGAPVHWR